MTGIDWDRETGEEVWATYWALCNEFDGWRADFCTNVGTVGSMDVSELLQSMRRLQSVLILTDDLKNKAMQWSVVNARGESA